VILTFIYLFNFTMMYNLILIKYLKILLTNIFFIGTIYAI